MAEASTSARGADYMDSQPSQLPEVSITGMQRRVSMGDLHLVGGDQPTSRPTKRVRDGEEEEDWIRVERGKRTRGTDGGTADDKIEAFVTSATELPKQFAFALFLKENGITNVLRIKYINSMKILMHFENVTSFEKLLNCEAAKDKGWRMYRTSETESSFGVIRRVELDLTDEDIMRSVTCDAELLSVKRLSRRSNDGAGWTPSECVRLCFGGSSLPQHVYVHGIRVKVDTYTFPVTQCSFCWAYGHTRKMCPRKKVVCVKCSKHHENCDTLTFVCVNCNGNHLALSKKCPVYLKERKIRSVMADFNCNYRKAVTMYVPATSPIAADIDYTLSPHITRTPSRLGPRIEDQDFRLDLPDSQRTASYASVVRNSSSKTNTATRTTGEKNKLTSDQRNKKKIIKRSSHNQKVNNDFTFNWDCYCSDSECGGGPENETNQASSSERREKRRIEHEEKSPFEKILGSLKKTFFREEGSIIEKLKTAAKIVIEWLVSFLVKYLRDLPLINSFLNNCV